MNTETTRTVDYRDTIHPHRIVGEDGSFYNCVPVISGRTVIAQDGEESGVFPSRMRELVIAGKPLVKGSPCHKYPGILPDRPETAAAFVRAKGGKSGHCWKILPDVGSHPDAPSTRGRRVETISGAVRAAERACRDRD